MLSREIMKRLDIIQDADIIIAIDSNGKYEIHNLEVIATGLAKYFPDLKTVIVKKSDNKVMDTDFLTFDPYSKRELNFIYTPFIPVHKILLTYEEQMDRKKFLHDVFQMGDILNCNSLLILSENLDTLRPECIENLLGPVIKANYDFVVPSYICHRDIFLMTNNFIYPLFKSFYGTELFYPSDGDYGLSIDLVRTFLEKDIWSNDIDIDMAMAIIAMGDEFEIARAFLGAKSNDELLNFPYMKNKFTSVLKAFVSLAGIYKDLNVYEEGNLKETPLFGLPFKIYPQAITDSSEKFLEEGKSLYKSSFEVIKSILREDTFYSVNALISEDVISITDELWVNIIIDYIAYFNNDDTYYDMCSSIIPLYFLRSSSFLKETSSMKEDEFNKRVDGLYRLFKEKRWEIN